MCGQTIIILFIIAELPAIENGADTVGAVVGTLFAIALLIATAVITGTISYTIYIKKSILLICIVIVFDEAYYLLGTIVYNTGSKIDHKKR